MTRKALIIGGTGQIGRAAASRLVRAGWSVTVASRTGTAIADSPGLVLDRGDTEALLAAARGQDLVVDVVAYGPAQAGQLARLAGEVGSLVVISTGAVYRGAEDDQDALPVPVPEDWPVLSLDPATAGGHLAYGAGKAAVERILLDTPGLPVSVLRPGTLHGPYSTSLHQWSFIKPALDRRPHIVLAYDGASRFSTSATANVAELIRLCADKPAARVLNAADDETLTVAAIGARIFAQMSHECEIVTFPGPPRPDGLGFNPWGVPSDIVLDMAKARVELGYVPAVSYDEALCTDIDWAVGAVRAAEVAGRSWADVFGGLVARFGTACWFPYDAEDAYMASLRRGD
jgi:nucleoside-diphosphate-sugar epimerase